jgi:hypothetical protein
MKFTLGVAQSNAIRPGGKVGRCHTRSGVEGHVDTYQWSREILRTQGRGRVVAAQVRLPGAEPVTVGRYDEAATSTTAAGAWPGSGAWRTGAGGRCSCPGRSRRARRAVSANCADRSGGGASRTPHGTAPCTCAGCRERGGFGAQRLRERRPDPLDRPFPPVSVLLGRLRAADSSDVDAIVEALRGFDGRRRGPVDQVAHLAEHPDSRVRTALVWAVARWSTPGALGLVERLAGHPDPAVRDAATAWLGDED